MSKKAKNASKLRRLMAKRSRKTANKSRWQKMAEMGENSFSKRFKRNNSKNKKVNAISHDGVANCGNPACRRCFKNVDGHIRKAS